MMEPTDEELNRAMAEALDITETCPSCEGAGGGKNFSAISLDDGAWDCQRCEGEGILYIDGYHDYCTDKNAHAPIYEALEAAGVEHLFLKAMRQYQPHSNRVMWNALVASGRTVVIAALKALNKWQSDWNSE